MAGRWLRRAADRTQAEHHALERLLEVCPEAGLAFSLTERFTSLVREGQGDAREVPNRLMRHATAQLEEVRA